MKKFEDFNLKKTTMEFITKNEFLKPTPIQSEVLPAMLRKKGIIGLSKTGTGKTHAYLIPLMEMVDSSLSQPQAVITAPTRELAIQIFEKAKLMQEIDEHLIVRLFVGGQDREKDLLKLKTAQPHILIGTPGRIKDLFLESSALRIDQTKVLIIDEADMTLEYGFLDDIDTFAGHMPEDLQMLAFSATMPEQLKPFLRKYMHRPQIVQIGDDTKYNPQIEHILIPCYHHTYAQTIYSILAGFQPYVCLIFCNTRVEAKEIAEDLRKFDVPVLELHGDLESRKRKQAMKQLRQHQYRYVVATDLAARGIDLDAISHVISCGFPDDLEYYIHRAGRTGRAGSKGICYALYKENDAAAIRSLQNRGIHFLHRRFKSSTWQTLRAYGKKFEGTSDEMKKTIAKMMTKKKTKVKPGYKKKRTAEIEKLHRQKKRDFIRSKIKEEKKALYKQRQMELNQASGRNKK